MKHQKLLLSFLGILVSARQGVQSPTPDLEGGIRRIENEMPALSAKGL